MRNIVLKRGSVAVYDDGAPFLAELGELSLCFTLPDPNGDYFAVTGKKKYAIGKDGHVSIPVELGELRLAVKRYIGGRLVESYAVEPLEIKSVDGNVTAFPEISVLQKQVVELTAELKAQREENAKEVEKVRQEMKREIRTLVTAFLSFAWAEYEYDVQLNAKNLTAEKFVAMLGYSVTDEEMEKIKGFGGKV